MNSSGDRTALEKAQQSSVLSSNDSKSQADKKITLIDTVQFIYQLELAQLELRSLGAQFNVKDGFREFELIDAEDEERIRKRVAHFKLVHGKYTDYFRIIAKKRTKAINQYLTHWFYPHAAKFHPQMIRSLLNVIGLRRGDTLLDPFIGSGTAALEAQLLGINCIGIDISPLCVLQSRVKTESVEVLPRIIEWKEEIMKSTGPLSGNWGSRVDEVIDSILDERVRNFYKMAKLIALSDQLKGMRGLSEAFSRRLELMILSTEDLYRISKNLGLKLGTVDIREGDSRDLPLRSESVDGIVTSPPYSIGLDYVVNDAHALKELECNTSEMREKCIGIRGKGRERVDLYKEDVGKFLEETHRILKCNGQAVVIAGNTTYLDHEAKIVKFIVNYAERIGLRLTRNIDKGIFGVYNFMQKENILFFRKA